MNNCCPGCTSDDCPVYFGCACPDYNIEDQKQSPDTRTTYSLLQ